jgi:rubredoxin
MPTKPTRKCSVCSQSKPKHAFLNDSRVCPECRQPHTQRNAEYNRRKRMSLWGEICEYFVCTPNVTVREVADHFGMHQVHVGTIITKYLGNGKPVIVHFVPDE